LVSVSGDTVFGHTENCIKGVGPFLKWEDFVNGWHCIIWEQIPVEYIFVDPLGL
jgi:hypothetical protein